MHKTARCSTSFTVCSTSPASPTPTAAEARISSSSASAHQPFGTSTIFATTTTCPCPCMATLGCSRRATTTANLMPYVKTHYRTSGRSLGIGHSLSASFVLDAMITDDLFDDYIAISPNCAYDEYRLATDIENHQFKNRKAPRFIYASMSGEIDSGPGFWGDEWKAGWERVSTFLKDKAHFPENTVTSVHTFPGYGHYNGFMPSLTAALNDYIVFGAKNMVSYVGEETYPVHIELRGKNLTDTIYITGNQDALANWEAKGVKMTLTSDSIASIDLRLHLPAQFKFTRGSWEREAIISNADAGNQIIHDAEHATRVYRLWERNQWMGE